MIMKYLYVTVLWVVLLSCGNSPSQTTSQESLPSKDDVVNNADDSYTTQTFYKRYEGTIANQPVVLYLEKNDSVYHGTYYYTKVGEPITLMSSESQIKDSLVFEELNEHISSSDTIVTKLLCVFKQQDIIGQWVRGSKKHEVILHEKYTDGSYSFTMKKFIRTYKFPSENDHSPSASSSYKFPWATDGNPAAVWLNAQIKKSLGITDKNTSLELGIKGIVDSYFSQYQNNIAEEMKLLSDTEYRYSMNHDESLDNKLLYNENGFVVIESNVYSYTGGAHGNYGTLYENYDVQSKKVLTLQDVIAIDSISLQRILETQFRKDQKIPRPRPLTEVLFESYLATTNNFAITTTGLNFLYNPYEIASYAQGQMQVYIPYASLSSYFTPYFKQRMKL